LQVATNINSDIYKPVKQLKKYWAGVSLSLNSLVWGVELWLANSISW